MIKVITLKSGAWDIDIHKTPEENINKNECIYAWESSILNQFINEGWNINDWKMTKSKNGRTWTFILEKHLFS